MDSYKNLQEIFQNQIGPAVFFHAEHLLPILANFLGVRVQVHEKVGL